MRGVTSRLRGRTGALSPSPAAIPAEEAPQPPEDPFALDLRDYGFMSGTFTSPPFQMDLDSTRFVLEGRAYPLVPYIDAPEVVVDCGGNAGATACYFARAYPAARILSFEPSARVFDFHRRNTAPFPNITGLPFGLTDHDGGATLYAGRDSTVTQSVVANSYTTEDTETIELREARAALAAEDVERIDILKLDTQGAEVAILRALSDLLPAISVIYVEYHAERDRIAIDRMLTPTHLVVSGRIDIPHIGELCYVNAERYWERGDLGHYEISDDG